MYCGGHARGRVINTGDWRLDPEPLTRCLQTSPVYGSYDEGVLLMMSDSTGADKPGRTPTEHTLQESFHDMIGRAEGRVFCSYFSSNMNRATNDCKCRCSPAAAWHWMAAV